MFKLGDKVWLAFGEDALPAVICAVSEHTWLGVNSTLPSPPTYSYKARSSTQAVYTVEEADPTSELRASWETYAYRDELTVLQEIHKMCENKVAQSKREVEYWEKRLLRVTIKINEVNAAKPKGKKRSKK